MNKKTRELVYSILTEELIGDGLLGTERTLSDYELFTGLNFKTGEVIENC